jgi:hypothetical protein
MDFNNNLDAGINTEVSPYQDDDPECNDIAFDPADLICQFLTSVEAIPNEWAPPMPTLAEELEPGVMIVPPPLSFKPQQKCQKHVHHHG